MKSSSETIRFGRFTLIPAERRLLDGREPVALNARYLDALILLARAPQAVVTKERLHDEVWRGVAVTDEALTQCIRALRKALGDNAVSPTYIETVPKHGYRFIAPVQQGARTEPQSVDGPLAQAGAITLGGVQAGAVVGLLYGLADAGTGGTSLSLLIVVTCVAALAAGLSALGIALGIALIGGRSGGHTVLGGALGGFLMGGLANLLGKDAFRLLFGETPQQITGAPEGLVLGLACGICIAILDARGRRAGVFAALAIGGGTGALVILAGGTLLGGSLTALAETFPGSQLSLPIPAGQLRWLLQLSGGALEGAIFAGGLVLGRIGHARLRPA